MSVMRSSKEKRAYSHAMQVCTAKGSTILKCIAPKFPKDFSLDDFERERRSRNIDNFINYTITMDGADGPESSNEDLQLRLKPNPVFLKLHEDDREYTLESEHTVRIIVSQFSLLLLPNYVCCFLDSGIVV